MCVIEFDDYCEVWENAIRTAREQHQCDSCFRPIRRGEQYRDHFSVFQGDATDEKQCSDCMVDAETFDNAHKCGLIPGDFHHYLVKCIADGDDESEKLWKPMLKRLEARTMAWGGR